MISTVRPTVNRPRAAVVPPITVSLGSREAIGAPRPALRVVGLGTLVPDELHALLPLTNRAPDDGELPSGSVGTCELESDMRMHLERALDGCPAPCGWVIRPAEPIAWALVVPGSDPRDMEVAVYVSAPHRGAGLGRHLVDRAIEVSRALGARRFLCFPWSERGRALFRAAGAVPTGSGGKWIVEL